MSAWTGWDWIEELSDGLEFRAQRGGRSLEDEVLELPPRVVALALVTEMRHNPRLAWCRDRRCGHRVSKHKDGICMIEGCGCEGLVEDVAA